MRLDPALLAQPHCGEMRVGEERHAFAAERPEIVDALDFVNVNGDRCAAAAQDPDQRLGMRHLHDGETGPEPSDDFRGPILGPIPAAEYRVAAARIPRKALAQQHTLEPVGMAEPGPTGADSAPYPALDTPGLQGEAQLVRIALAAAAALRKMDVGRREQHTPDHSVAPIWIGENKYSGRRPADARPVSRHCGKVGQFLELARKYPDRIRWNKLPYAPRAGLADFFRLAVPGPEPLQRHLDAGGCRRVGEPKSVGRPFETLPDRPFSIETQPPSPVFPLRLRRRLASEAKQQRCAAVCSAYRPLAIGLPDGDERQSSGNAQLEQFDWGTSPPSEKTTSAGGRAAISRSTA